LRRHRPVQDHIEIRIGDAKAVEQILPAGKVVIEKLAARLIFLERVLSRA